MANCRAHSQFDLQQLLFWVNRKLPCDNFLLYTRLYTINIPAKRITLTVQATTELYNYERLHEDYYRQQLCTNPPAPCKTAEQSRVIALSLRLCFRVDTYVKKVSSSKKNITDNEITWQFTEKHKKLGSVHIHHLHRITS